MSRKRVPPNQNECTADFRIGVPFEQNLQRIRLRYSPDMKEIFIVEADGTLTPIRLLNKTENALIKREKVRLCKGDE
ncbi:hypothetical protein [Mediterraneibacter gnavus]|uniref:hypothetical protein n=1 Tax=Mediterraneibacter gnavus TaxID=33038 RepID=UPI0036F407FC